MLNSIAARKIVDIDSLSEILTKARAAGQSVVQCHGVFDLMHPGHIRHLAEAKQQGDILVVTVTSDEHVNKGPGRPVFNQALRAETLASLESVDYVTVNDEPTAINTISILRPDVFVKGSDYADPGDDITGMIVDEKEAVEAHGGRVHYTDDITFSSSSLINENFLSLPPETDKWLRNFRERYSEEAVVDAISGISDLNVLVIGEAIIDEYVFCNGLGKAAKDPILAFLHQSMEAFAGGSIAVANHLGDFCKRVEVITLIGEVERYEEFIRRSLHPNVSWRPVTQRGAPTLRKRRFVEEDSGSKLFEIYHMDDDTLHPLVEAEILASIEERIDQADIVIVPDYGHGMMTPAIIDLVCKKAKFLIVNTQANAGNRGFNTISKYPRADYICIAGHELELETRKRHGGWDEKLKALMERVNCSRFTVTLGHKGSFHYDSEQGAVEAPALASKVVDRVGAGDAVLAITGALVATDSNWEMVAFIGNAAGAQMVADLGNSRSLSKVGLLKHLTALLK